ncbi:MAG: RHS repeat-associated core domain-containing protein, partial [Bdellovibrio sp.]|nr:RHS repeat-associated core domain-containing protein [Bdellovibrio sp.]
YTHGVQSDDDVLALNVTSAGVTSGVATNAGSAYYLKDALGSVTDIINASGSIVQTYEYSAFGKVLKITNGAGADITISPVVKTFFSYTGREWDAEAGLYNFRARYYDPNLGRFMQKDPEPGRITTPITVVNSYIYCGNNPNIHTDPSGKGWLRFGAAVLAGVITALIIVASGGTATGAAIAVLSVAGGAAVTAIAMASLQEGDFWKNAENNFYPNYGMGLMMLILSVVYVHDFAGGVDPKTTGGNGLQGWIGAKGELIKDASSGLTIGHAAVVDSAARTAHEFGHTLQYIGISVALSRSDNPFLYSLGTYLLWGGYGVVDRNSWPESTANYLGNRTQGGW